MVSDPLDMLLCVKSNSVGGARNVGLRRAQEHFGPRFDVDIISQQTTLLTEESRPGRPTYAVDMTLRARHRQTELPTTMWGRLKRAIFK